MISCEKCGRLDSTLRGSSFIYTISVIFMTYRRGAGGVYCSRCRKKEGFKWTLVSALFGWWGFPWGPIYTLQAIGRNSAGGYQDASLNAGLLKAVAAELMERGDQPGAIDALETSLRLEDGPDARQALWSLQGELVSNTTQPASVPAAATFGPAPTFTPGAVVRSANGDAPLHAAPGGSAEQVGSLGSDTAIVTRAEADWVELHVPGGKAGWVPTSAIGARSRSDAEGKRVILDNPFRRLGLSATTSPRDVRRRIDELTVKASLGAAPAAPG